MGSRGAAAPTGGNMIRMKQVRVSGKDLERSSRDEQDKRWRSWVSEGNGIVSAPQNSPAIRFGAAAGGAPHDGGEKDGQDEAMDEDGDGAQAKKNPRSKKRPAAGDDSQKTRYQARRVDYSAIKADSVFFLCCENPAAFKKVMSLVNELGGKSAQLTLNISAKVMNGCFATFTTGTVIEFNLNPDFFFDYWYDPSGRPEREISIDITPLYNYLKIVQNNMLALYISASDESKGIMLTCERSHGGTQDHSQPLLNLMENYTPDLDDIEWHASFKGAPRSYAVCEQAGKIISDSMHTVISIDKNRLIISNTVDVGNGTNSYTLDKTRHAEFVDGIKCSVPCYDERNQMIEGEGRCWVRVKTELFKRISKLSAFFSVKKAVAATARSPGDIATLTVPQAAGASGTTVVQPHMAVSISHRHIVRFDCIFETGNIMIILQHTGDPGDDDTDAELNATMLASLRHAKQ